MKKKTKSTTSNLPVPTVPAQKACAISGDAEAASAIRQQYSAVINAECVVFKERVRLGLMLLEWERFLGEARGGAGGTSSVGLKGWLKANIPELRYVAAMSYKTMAERTIKMLGGGAVVTAALKGNDQIVQPDGEVVDVPSDVVESCEQFFEKVDSRRKLEQMYLDFMVRKPGRPKGTTANKKVSAATLSPEEDARALWSRLIAPAQTYGLEPAASLLTADDAETALEILTGLCDILKRRLGR